MSILPALTWRHAIALLGSAVVAVPCYALQLATDSPDDYRIKSVPYSETDVVEINAVVGLTTHIWLDDGEEYVTHAFGDSAAWELADNGNHIFVKPKGANGDTNLTLITNKRVYNILLDYIGDWKSTDEHGNTVSNPIETPWSLRSATIQLKYNYPEEERALAQAQEYQRAESERINRALNGLYQEADVNLGYVMSDEPGSESIRPVNVWDNNRFTFFKFAPGAALPTITVLGSDGRETVVNTHIEGDNGNIIVAHRTAAQWFIRSGQKVVGVVNNDYSPNQAPQSTGTSSRQVRRVIQSQEVDQ